MGKFEGAISISYWPQGSGAWNWHAASGRLALTPELLHFGVIFFDAIAMTPEQFFRQSEQRLPVTMLIHGDEPLQLRELTDHVRRQAALQGHNERIRLVADGDFDWASTQEISYTQSLFADRQLIDIGLEKMPTKQDLPHVLRLVEGAGDSYSVMIHGARLAKKDRNSAWAEALVNRGVEVQIWPPNTEQLPAFLNRRLSQAGFVADTEALSALVERVEGNLLAADQEIKKLAMVLPAGNLTAQHIKDSVSNHARFEIDDLIVALAEGDMGRFVKVATALRDEAVHVVVVLAALSREVRSIINPLKPKGMPRFVLQRWQRAERRLHRAHWVRYLHALGQLDFVAKGRDVVSGDPWRDLIRMSRPVLKR